MSEELEGTSSEPEAADAGTAADATGAAVPPPPPVATAPVPPPPAPAAAGVPAAMGPAASGKKLPAGICGILLGAFGVHKFILGYTGAALTMLLVTVLTCGIGGAVMGIIGLIEGIIYLTKSDAEFDQIYVENRRTWF